MNRTISATELKALFARGGDFVLLDVGRKNDYESDAVKAARAEWRDPEKLGEWSTTLPQYGDVILYCVHGGSISNSVVDALRAEGRNARCIAGGIEAWKEAGGPVVSK